MGRRGDGAWGAIMKETKKPWEISKHQKGMSAAVRNSQAGQAEYQPHPAHSRPAVRVEYPRQGEAIARPSYTLRVAVPPGEGIDVVEVAIDGGPWLACREGLGLWWYDWSGYAPGEHEVAARTRLPGGTYAAAAPCRFRVE